MPTSSQARILGRRSSDTEKVGTSEMTVSNTMGPLVNRHRSCVLSEGTLFHPVGLCNYHQPLLHMPRINLQSGVADYFMKNGFGPNSPRDELNARARAEFPHSNRMPPTPRNAFNTSNNWPNNTEDGAKESLPDINGPTDGPSEAGTSDPPKPSGSRKTSKQGSFQRQESDAQPKRRISASGNFSRKHSKEVKKKTSVKAKQASRDSTEVTNEEAEGSGSTSRSFTFEVDLLKIRSRDARSSEANLDTSETVEEPKPELVTERPTGEAPKHSMKTLFKQLLSIGVMSNAFRGVTVQTATGEKHGATEQETEAALETMVTDMVEDDEEEEDDEEDDEEMELVMGSLLHNVGSRIEMHEDESGVKPPTPKPKPPAKPPTLITPGRPGARPSISKTGPATASKPGAASKPVVKPPSTQDAGWKTGGTSEMEDILAATALPKEEPAPIEEDPEKAFLKEVLTGSLYGNKGKAATLAPPPKPELLKKKKVFKIPPIRLRKAIPIGNPDLLAIRTPNVDLIHEQVKNMLEAQLGTIVSLQHEPEYLQTGDVPLPIRAMWIFKMEDVSVNNHTRICCTGIVDYEGETLRIRRRDDIFQEEHRAYLLVKQIKEEQALRLKNKKKGKAPPARAKSPLPP